MRVLNDAGNGTFAQIICGIDWVSANAAAKNIQVANMSLGGPSAAPQSACPGTTTRSIWRSATRPTRERA